MEKFRHGGNIYKEPAPKGTWLDFSANINPLGLSDRVRQCILEHIDDVVHYPDPDAKALKTGIASHYGLPLEEIVLGNGASELLYLFFGMMRFSHVLLPQPAFSDYERAAVAAGSRVEYFFTDPEDGFRVSWEGLLARIPSVDCIDSAIPIIRQAPCFWQRNWKNAWKLSQSAHGSWWMSRFWNSGRMKSDIRCAILWSAIPIFSYCVP